LQFLLKEGPDRDGLVRLRGEDYHYLVNVRRLMPGSVFTALLPPLDSNRGSPGRVAVTVTGIDNQTLTGSVVSAENGQVSAPCHENIPPIILFQALPKGTKMDLIVRQAAECGLSEIVPFVSEHSVPRELSRDRRLERWRRIIKEARQQSGSVVDTRIQGPLDTGELFAYWEKLQADATPADSIPAGTASSGCETAAALGLMFTPSAIEQESFHRYLYTIPPLIVLAVGPEGGFSGSELGRFADAGFKQLSLGKTVLRVETAALYGAAAVKIILMERAWWTQQ
jgi:16S rRNA (uracil1498-N3)-methyltransferase